MSKCEVCETAFETRSGRQKYCSNKCKQAAYRQRVRQGRAVPENAVTELESLRRSRDYYRTKADRLEFERDMAVLDSQLMKPFNWVTNQPVVEYLTDSEEDELAKLRRYVRQREKDEWRRPFAGLRKTGRRVPLSVGEASEFTYEIYEDVATLRVKLDAAGTARVWEDLGYAGEDEWWSSVLNAAHDVMGPVTLADDEYSEPEWLKTHDEATYEPEAEGVLPRPQHLPMTGGGAGSM
jgi:HSP20 family molecular chaperone IbpA